jgi:hypothetical protein
MVADGLLVRDKVLIIVPFLLIRRYICMHLCNSGPDYCSYEALYECTQQRRRIMQFLQFKLRPGGDTQPLSHQSYLGRRLTQLHVHILTIQPFITLLSKQHPLYILLCHSHSPYLTSTLCTSLSALHIFVRIAKLLVPLLAPGPHYTFDTYQRPTTYTAKDISMVSPKL